MKKTEAAMDKALGHGDFAPDKTNQDGSAPAAKPPALAPAPNREPGALSTFRAKPPGWSDRVVEAFDSLIVQVPVAGAEAEDVILRQLADAETLSDLNAPWEAEGLRRFVDQQVIVHALRRAPSAYEGPLNWYLVLDVEISATGERLTVTTGSISVMAQLLKAHSLGKIPVRVLPRVAKRPSAKGFTPMHLEFVDLN